LFESNLPVNTAERTAIEGIRSNLYASAVGGSEARLGFFVQDLSNGDYIAHGADNPFYMASTTKVFIGAWIAKHRNLASTITLRPQDWRGELRGEPAFDLADFNNSSFTYNRFLEAMLTVSDTAATDRLFGIATQATLKTDMRDSLGLQNVGEVTSICELDKRIVGSNSSNACVFTDVSCDSFEDELRGDGGYGVTAGSNEAACLNGLIDVDSKSNYDAYYSTRANSITPSEYGHALKVLSGTTYFTNAQRAAFIDALGGHDGYCSGGVGDVQYDSCATKGGTKNYSKSQVGIMFDFNGAVGDFTQITPRFTFAIFADNLAQKDTGPAEPFMRDIITQAVNFLVNH
jgi:hypothetical protein